MSQVNLMSIPAPLSWENLPAAWNIDNGEVLSIQAGRITDLFIDPNGKGRSTNSPRLIFRPQGDFTLSAHVKVNFKSKFDAGVLLIYAHEHLWAKLCFEYSPQHKPTIVSVVTREFSDDCNSITVDSDETYLRIAKIDNTFALHMSYDGRFWHLLRYFTLGEIGEYSVGFSAQSPTGESCAVTFDQIQYQSRRLSDLRSGE